MEDDELASINKYFNSVNSRVLIKQGDLVISRFSVLPYFKEQENDINLIGAKLINSYKQHNYVADIGEWYLDLVEELTPKTWFSLEEIDEDGPYVLKGSCNSRKNRWKTHMLAPDLKAAKNIHWELSNDPLFNDSQQNICIRKFVNLYKYFDGINGAPVTKELRFFIYKDTILSGAYYWSSYVDDIKEVPTAEEVPLDFLSKVIYRIKDNINFYVVDVGQLQTGEWIVIELNDGQMAGLSENNPDILYKNLKNALDTEQLIIKGK